MEISPIIIWFVVGLVLILMEFVIPGLVIVFFGLGAWVAAIFVAIFPEMAFWVQTLFLKSRRC
jgi:membrane protein implicated in regulation of membrane protease activity